MSNGRIAPRDLSDLFCNGMKGYINMYPPDPPSGVVLNLGCGNSPISGAVNLDALGSRGAYFGLGTDQAPNDEINGVFRWQAPNLGYNDDTVAAIHAYHFLEHLDGDLVKVQIQEVERVLKPGGVFYYCVPYAMAPIAFMDVDHKTYWTEETMRTLLESRGYESGVTSRLKYYSQVIIGANSQNLAILGVLKKES